MLFLLSPYLISGKKPYLNLSNTHILLFILLPFRSYSIGLTAFVNIVALNPFFIKMPSNPTLTSPIWILTIGSTKTNFPLTIFLASLKKSEYKTLSSLTILDCSLHLKYIYLFLQHLNFSIKPLVISSHNHRKDLITQF